MFVKIMACVLALAGVGLVVAAMAKTQHPIRKAMTSAVCGIGTLGAVNLLGGITGVTVALNFVTAFIAVAFSAPGVITLLFIQLILNG
ncbi:MAG: pro-sigmaK processing inhibitor BofA family protein [Oscillospiraceae bacterium]|nr:pro-sigmaK processing inhibitor BofA family protein [Oscillospiraceae bacterium]